jgi:hypothetical protein
MRELQEIVDEFNGLVAQDQGLLAQSVKVAGGESDRSAASIQAQRGVVIGRQQELRREYKGRMHQMHAALLKSLTTPS